MLALKGAFQLFLGFIQYNNLPHNKRLKAGLKDSKSARDLYFSQVTASAFCYFLFMMKRK
jgi:hypothetical protein